jgi:hypothetical protein
MREAPSEWRPSPLYLRCSTEALRVVVGEGNDASHPPAHDGENDSDHDDADLE